MSCWAIDRAALYRFAAGPHGLLDSLYFGLQRSRHFSCTSNLAPVDMDTTFITIHGRYSL